MSIKKQASVKWAPIAGRWTCVERTVKYDGPEEQRDPFGLVLSSDRLRQGNLEVTVKLEDPIANSARLVLGYDSSSGNYFSVGIGGYGRAYVLDEFVQGKGWGGLALQGSTGNIQKSVDIALRVDLRGQRARLTVDDVTVIEQNLPHPLLGDQVGLFAWGPSPVAFNRFGITASPPRVFVIMQFTEPFNSFFRHVIQPVAMRSGLEAFRGSDIYKPGIILDDIIRDILESEVIIAEITPSNANVFYELGYAHALGKQTILLADRASASLPFDIRGYRVIFYENTIKGKPEVERELEAHLKSIMSGFE